MLQYERTDILERIRIKNSEKSNECIIFLYWYFELNVCNISISIYQSWLMTYKILQH